MNKIFVTFVTLLAFTTMAHSHRLNARETIFFDCLMYVASNTKYGTPVIDVYGAVPFCAANKVTPKMKNRLILLAVSELFKRLEAAEK